MSQVVKIAARMAPYYDNGRWFWPMPALTWSTERAALLEHIPGLTINVRDGVLSGSGDAMLVAAKRLGEPVDSFSFVRSYGPLNVWISKEFRSYQQIGVRWLASHLRQDAGAILADDMGLGKTAQAIVAIGNLKVAKVLILCPGSVRPTWEREITKWAPGSKPVALYDGVTAAKVTNEPILITSYELAAKLPQHYSPDAIVLDEAHLLRGRRTLRSKRVEQLCAQATFRLALTGTPLWSRPRDLWMILKCLFRKRFGTADEFDYAYCGAFENEYGGKENSGSTREDELRLRLSHVMLRRTKAEVLKDLPRMQRTVEWLDADAASTRAFQSAVMRRSGEAIATGLQATLRSKMGRAIELAAEARQFLLVTWMKSHAAEISRKLNESGTPCELITGDIDVQLRSKLILNAAANKHGVVATTDSIGVGVDGLQHVASIGICHALDYVPLKVLQVEARLDRLGQKLPVQWVYLAQKESMDQLVIQTVIEKLDQTSRVMGEKYGLRDSLGDYVDGAGAKNAEKEAMKAIYDAMED